LYKEAYELSSNSIDKPPAGFQLSTALLRRGADSKQAAVETLEESLESIKLVIQQLMNNQGMAPKSMVPRLEALPSWKQRIEQRLAELKQDVATQ
jgi:hypothetical protein